ncbi:MAG: SDR family NAD(P)-dependent oxidoreductase, partial [Ilumatobacteraceae bacterium]
RDCGCRQGTRRGRDRDRCATLRSRHPGLQVVEIDLATPGAGRQLVEGAVGILGGLDVVINDAAMQVHEWFVPVPAEGIDGRIDGEIAVNLTARIEITAAAMPALVGSTAAALVYVTSGLAVFPKKTAPVYCATKSALRTFAAAVRYQLSDSAAHVKVIDAVLPLVDTPMTAGRGSAGGKMSPEAVAE